MRVRASATSANAGANLSPSFGWLFAPRPGSVAPHVFSQYGLPFSFVSL
jgi:hypothetical protein